MPVAVAAAAAVAAANKYAEPAKEVGPEQAKENEGDQAMEAEPEKVMENEGDQAMEVEGDQAMEENGEAGPVADKVERQREPGKNAFDYFYTTFKNASEVIEMAMKRWLLMTKAEKSRYNRGQLAKVKRLEAKK